MGLLALLPVPARAGEVRTSAFIKQDEKPAAVGQCIAAPGALLQRESAGKPWRSIQAKESVPGEVLLVALPSAEIHSKNDAVLLRMLADVAGRATDPVYECAVTLHDNPRVDLDVTLDRGRMSVTNRKAKGEARVRIRFWGQTWNLVLKDPETTVGLQLIGRHPAGLRSFAKDPEKEFKSDYDPTAIVFLLVFRGQVELTTATHSFALQAPPGRAFLNWDSVASNHFQLRRLEELPKSITEPLDKEEEKRARLIHDWCDQLDQKPIQEVLSKSLQSDTIEHRKLALVCLGALDDLPRLVDALSEPKRADVRDMAISVVRHWMGRTPGHDEALYKHLTADKKLSARDAKTILQLLYGADASELTPEVYEVLALFLRHEQLAIRELARWHLVRLIPEGKDIPYDANGPVEQREQAYKKWKELVMRGQVPPKNLPPEKEGK
jgi:hypothetical protein